MVLRMDRMRTRGRRLADKVGSEAEAVTTAGAISPVLWEARQQNSDSTQAGKPPSAVTAPPLSVDPRNAVAVASLAALAFVAIALAMAEIANTHLTVPRSGNIPGLAVNYWVPPIGAALGYLLLQCATRYLGSSRLSWRTIAARAVGDYLLLGLFILVVYIHFNIKMWIPVINPRDYDSDYFAIDQALGWLIVVFDYARSFLARILPDADVWYQAAFFAIFVLSFLAHALGNRRFHYHSITALILIESIGPLTYLIAPAIGPFIFQHGQNVLATAAELRMYSVHEMVRAGGADWIKEYGGQFFADPPAAMPSLHVGASFIIAYYAVRARLWVAPVTVFAFCWIFVESVAARWHYLVDLPAGLMLAVAVIAATNYLYRRISSRPDRAQEPAAEESTEAGTPAPALRAQVIQATGQRQPIVWVLKCHRVGDHAQSLALARALGWPFIVKETEFHWYELFFALASCATLAGLHRSRSSRLEPPWPDLIILAGRRNETPAKWIRKQSGGRTRIVVIGRYWTPPNELDFVVTTPQFRLPTSPNVLLNTLPLQPANTPALAEAAEVWAPRLGDTRGPYLTVLVGGTSGPYTFSRESARRLGRDASALARSLGATLLVSTSARTTHGAMRALERAIDVPYHFYRWRPHDADNPHLGFLALADTIIVTADSLSMIAEACSTGRPVYLFEFGGGPAAMRGPRLADTRIRQWWRWSQIRDQGILRLPYAWAIGLPAWRINRSRDIRLAQDRVIASGQAQWLDDTAAAPLHPKPARDLERAVACITKLMSMEQGEGTRAVWRSSFEDRISEGALADAANSDSAVLYPAPAFRGWTPGSS